MRERSSYEQKLEMPQAGSTVVMRIYPEGMSPEIIFESLVRREILYKRLRRIPNDPRVSRKVKDTLIITGE